MPACAWQVRARIAQSATLLHTFQPPTASELSDVPGGMLSLCHGASYGTVRVGLTLCWLINCCDSWVHRVVVLCFDSPSAMRMCQGTREAVVHVVFPPGKW